MSECATKIECVPNEDIIQWLVKHVGPRTHYTAKSIGGKGWRFTRYGATPWYLVFDDEKLLVYFLLMR